MEAWKERPRENPGDDKKDIQYVKRRELAIVHVKSIIKIIAMFPPMQNMLYVSTV